MLQPPRMPPNNYNDNSYTIATHLNFQGKKLLEGAYLTSILQNVHSHKTSLLILDDNTSSHYVAELNSDLCDSHSKGE